jgi:uncharacterized protein (DUF302 family)
MPEGEGRGSEFFLGVEAKVMSQEAFTLQAFQGKRARFESRRSFEDVLATLRKLVPRSMPLPEYPAAMEKAGGVNLETFEKVAGSQVGECGFTLFQEFDHGAWLPLFGIRRKVVRWVLGNPLLAITMMRHDPEAGLFAPVELLLVDHERESGSTVIYDVPSSLMVLRENPPLLEAAKVLDGKLEDLVRQATG